MNTIEKEAIKNEINQLWFVAQEYYFMALEEKKNLSDEEMLCTVKDLAIKAETLDLLKENRNITLFTAHLASCAVRLYSIDENKNKIGISKRISSYNNIKGYGNKIEKIEEKIKREMHTYIHFLLRHTICHAEIERFKRPSLVKALDEIYKVYLSLTIEEIFNGMQELMKNMKEELE